MNSFFRGYVLYEVYTTHKTLSGENNKIRTYPTDGSTWLGYEKDKKGFVEQQVVHRSRTNLRDENIPFFRKLYTYIPACSKYLVASNVRTILSLPFRMVNSNHLEQVIYNFVCLHQNYPF